MGLHMSAQRGCAQAQHGAAHERRQHGAAQGHSMGLRMSSDWGCAWVLRGVAQGRSMGLRMSAAWGCA